MFFLPIDRKNNRPTLISNVLALARVAVKSLANFAVVGALVGATHPLVAHQALGDGRRAAHHALEFNLFGVRHGLFFCRRWKKTRRSQFCSAICWRSQEY